MVRRVPICPEFCRGARTLRVRAIWIGLLAVSAALAVIAAAPVQKTKPAGAKKTAKKASTARTSKAKGTAAAKGAAEKKAASSKTSSAKKSSAKQTARYRRSTQREPDPDRYKEIQQSLADRGYYSGPVNGAWGPDSVEALKRFQRDQNIDDDGKLGALSLIALGLGPKRGAGGAEKADDSSGAPSPP